MASSNVITCCQMRHPSGASALKLMQDRSGDAHHLHGLAGWLDHNVVTVAPHDEQWADNSCVKNSGSLHGRLQSCSMLTSGCTCSVSDTVYIV